MRCQCTPLSGMAAPWMPGLPRQLTLPRSAVALREPVPSLLGLTSTSGVWACTPPTPGSAAPRREPAALPSPRSTGPRREPGPSSLAPPSACQTVGDHHGTCCSRHMHPASDVHNTWEHTQGPRSFERRLSMSCLPVLVLSAASENRLAWAGSGGPAVVGLLRGARGDASSAAAPCASCICLSRAANAPEEAACSSPGCRALPLAGMPAPAAGEGACVRALAAELRVGEAKRARLLLRLLMLAPLESSSRFCPSSASSAGAGQHIDISYAGSAMAGAVPAAAI